MLKIPVLKSLTERKSSNKWGEGLLRHLKYTYFEYIILLSANITNESQTPIMS